MESAYYPPAITRQPVSGNITDHASSSTRIRNMTDADCEFAARVTLESFRSKFEHVVGRQNFDKVLPGMIEDQRLSQHRYHRIFIAECDGQPAGVLEIRFHGERDSDGNNPKYERHLGCCSLCRLAMLGYALKEDIPHGKCYIDHICVDDSFRGKGIGKSLMMKADEEAQKMHCSVVYLHVAFDNRARNLYERQGFVAVGEESGCTVRCITGIQSFIKMEKRVM